MPEPANTPLIPAATCYIGAWTEIATRLTVRSNLNVYHIASVIGLTAAHFSIPREHSELRLIPAAAIPIVSAIFVMWYRHNDYIIGALIAYCKQYERIDFDNKVALPLWFYTPPNRKGIQSYVTRFRLWSDGARTTICLVSPILALVDIHLYRSANELGNALAIQLFCLFAGCLGISLWLVWLMIGVSGKRTRLVAESEYDAERGHWSLPEI